MTPKQKYLVQFVALFFIVYFSAMAGESYKEGRSFNLTLDVFCVLMWFFNFHTMWYSRYIREKRVYQRQSQ